MRFHYTIKEISVFHKLKKTFAVKYPLLINLAILFKLISF